MTKQNFGRFALFIIYFWFGILKVLGKSPASAMVLSLEKITVPFIDPSTFMILFGLFECLIGILFLFPRFRKLSISLFTLHMVSTVLPLFVLPHMAWSGYLIPTLEGQYIIKNIALIAIVLTL